VVKISVLLLTSQDTKYRRILENGALKTWMSKSPDGISIIPYRGKAISLKGRFLDQIREYLRFSPLKGIQHFLDDQSFSHRKIKSSRLGIDNCLESDIPESIANVSLRFISAVKWMAENLEFDFLWHSNLSSYVNLEKLAETVSIMDAKEVYGGVISSECNVVFVSGAGFLLSRDVVEEILGNLSRWDFSLLWDVALGKLLTNQGIYPVHMDRLTISTLEMVANTNSDALKSVVSIRCHGGHNRLLDIEILNAIHKKCTSDLP
jgi:hypothetical protein